MAKIHGKSSTSPTSKPAGKTSTQTTKDYLICRVKGRKDYSFWSVDINRKTLLEVEGSPTNFEHPNNDIISVGNYILEWGPVQLKDYTGGIYPYRLFEFDAESGDPLGEQTIKSKKASGLWKNLKASGLWKKDKFYGTHADFGNPEGPSKEFWSGDRLLLVPLGTFVLNWIPTEGRGTHRLYSFDPGSQDPLYKAVKWVHGAFGTIEYDHELIPMGNYVLDRIPPDKKRYCLWSFDPMSEAVLPRPAIPNKRGVWDDIDKNHKLIPIGEYVLDWDVANGSYRLWHFDPSKDDPLMGDGLNGQGPMPKEIQDLAKSVTDVEDIALTGVQGLEEIVAPAVVESAVPGTIDFMRSKIKHVVYYMLENRSFDHVCGWVYDKNDKINRVGFQSGDFDGARLSDFNIDPRKDANDPERKVPVDTNQPNNLPAHDPYHDMTDTIRQCYSNYGPNGDNRYGYAKGKPADMGGFVWNNGMREVMSTFPRDQLPVLNGLAKDFAVSDRWFCSMPGATDSQRAFALTGSALLELDNFMNGPEYVNWPEKPHRASIWKVLCANGFRDWKIYNAVKWFEYVLSYHLFLKGQLPSVDQKVKDERKLKKKDGTYIASFERFLKDAENGTLPKFSYVEPVWIKFGEGGADATSYHPYGNGGTGPGEKALNDVYTALKKSDKWNETLLIITFDEHGGFYDHVPPPTAVKPWPNDEVDGFNYNLLGVRVPTILVSPWIKENTVFRAPADKTYDSDGTAHDSVYDSTSILATLLKWHGIPKARWWLGDRTRQAPTFEGVFTCSQPRKAPKTYPLPPTSALGGAGGPPTNLDAQYEVMVPRLVEALVGDRYTAQETTMIADNILERAVDLQTLDILLGELAEKRQWNLMA